MAKIQIVYSKAQATKLAEALAAVPKQTKTVEKLAEVVADAISGTEVDAKKVLVTLSPAQAEALIKVLGTLPKQTKTIEAIVAKTQDAVATVQA